MTKYLILTLCAACLSLTTQAALSDEVTTQWVKKLDAAPPDMGMNLLKSGDALYYFSITGSTIGDGGSGWPKSYTDTTANIYYDGNLIAKGAPYEGSSYNNNFNLLKTDLNGVAQWCVYSTSGEVASNNGGIVAAPDGGVYVSLKLRHTLNMTTEKPSFTDATGAVTTIDWVLDSEDASRYYHGVLMKVSAQGAIEWLRLFDISTEPQAAAGSNYTSGTWDALYIYGMLSDSDGNTYLAGRYANPLTFYTATGSITLTPHNTDGWNGDSQNSRGDMYLAKFDSNGYLIDVLTTTGVAQVETSTTLAWAGDDIILNAVVTGASSTDAITLLGNTISLSDQPSMITARLTKDLSAAKWIHTFPCDKIGSRTSVLQYNHVNVIGDNLWLTGMGNFTLYNDDRTTSIATVLDNVREGYIIKCDASTGEWLAATTSRTALNDFTGITGYLGGFENETGDNFYTFGYNWGGMGVFLCEFDNETLAFNQYCSLLTGGSMTLGNEMVASGNTLYTISRGRSVTTSGWELLSIGQDEVITTQEWAALFSAYQLPFTAKNETDNETTIKGDVNNDGIVSIADINAIIDVMIGGDTVDSELRRRADVNGDGEVSIADINTVIEILLG